MIEDYEYQVRVKALELALQLHGRLSGAAELVQAATVVEDYIRGKIGDPRRSVDPAPNPRTKW